MTVHVDPDDEESRTTRELRKSGNSIVVSIPPTILREAGFVVGEEVEIAAPFKGGVIEIREPRSDEEVSEDES